jgi:hypothetical protein
MIKNFQEFLYESLDDSFIIVTEGDIRATFGREDAEKISKFFNNEPMILFGDDSEDEALHIGQTLFKYLTEKTPKYYTHVSYNKSGTDPIYQFYVDPFKGISKLVLIVDYEDKYKPSILVLKDDIEKNWRGSLTSRKYGI